MNTNDLPPAARLASLIEAGRAAHPRVNHGQGRAIDPDSNSACAIGFAAMSVGASPHSFLMTSDAASKAGLVYDGVLGESMVSRVVRMNDREPKPSLDEICQSLREGELSKLPVAVTA